jgi:hypothetical protein
MYLLLGLTTAGAQDAASNAPKTLEPRSFTSRVDPERARLGEPFSYELVIRHPLTQRYDLRLPASDRVFEVLGLTRNRVDGRDSATTTFALKLGLFELGEKKLPDLTFDVVEGDRAGRFIVPGIAVEGISSLPKGSDEGTALRDIKPPEEIPVRSYRLLWALGALVGLAALSYAIYRWLKRERRPAQIQRPQEPLDVRILAALEELRSRNLPVQGRAREFYFRLSEIARAYLGERYGFEALECTSAELLEALREVHAPGLPMDELSQFAAESDLVKFAKASAEPAQCEQALEFARQLVRRTLQRPAEGGAGLANVVGAGEGSGHVNRSLLP